MAAHPIPPLDRRQNRRQPSERAKLVLSEPPRKGNFRSFGLGLITGASDDDPAAIGTYAAVGASFGPSFLWTVPVIFPMMFSVVYLCSKLGQVAGEGLFAVIRKHYSPWLLYPVLIGAVIGNVIEAGADMGGMAAAVRLMVPIPSWAIVAAIALIRIMSTVVLGVVSADAVTFAAVSLGALAVAFLACYIPAYRATKVDPLVTLRNE